MITLDFGPAVEAQIATLAKQFGLTPSEYVKKIILEHLPKLNNAEQEQQLKQSDETLNVLPTEQ